MVVAKRVLVQILVVEMEIVEVVAAVVIIKDVLVNHPATTHT